MAVSSEATVGHIIGFLRLDADQYFRTLAEADAAADRLGKKRVDLKVSADSAAANKGLRETAASMDKAEAAARRQQRTAYASYADNIKRSRELAAEQKKAAKWAQDSAYRSYADNIKAAKALDRVSESTDRVGRSAKRSHSNMRPLVTTILALGPAIGPLVGTTVGLAGALGGMGAAGIVALLGIKREMQEGTTLGSQFAKLVSELKYEFGGLETTASNAALAPFSKMVDSLSERMPFLNRTVNTFTNLLGSGSNSALTGIIDSLQTMEPLLISAGLWVDKLLAKFAAAAASGGLKEFTDYARSTLPLVEDTLENLVVAVVDLIRAFAPMGTGILAVLNDVARVLSGMPVEVLTALASGASAGFLAFQAWRGINAIVNGVIGGLKLMNSELVVSASVSRGLSLATAGVSLAIGAATLLYMRHAEAARKEQEAIDGMTDALLRSNGVIDESIRLAKAKELQDSGWAKFAAENGISLDLLTSAFLNNGAAVEAVTNKLLENQNAGRATGDVFTLQGGAADKTAADFLKLGNSHDVVVGKGGLLVNAMQQSNKEVTQAANAARDLTNAQRETAQVIDLTKSAVDRSMAGYNQAGAVYGITGAALKDFTDKQRDSAQQADDARAKMILESDAAGILKAALDKLNGKAITAAEAQNRFESALANMSDHTTKTGKKVVLTTKNLHGMSAASVSIRGDLISQVQAMQEVAEANGGLSKSTGKARQQLVDMRKQIIENAVAHGHDRKAVTEFIDSIFKIPKAVPPTKIDADKKEAERKLADLQHKLHLLERIRMVKVVADTGQPTTALQYLNTLVTTVDGKTVTIKTRYVNEGTLPNGGRAMVGGTTKGEALPGPPQPGRKDGTKNANGAIYKAFANGGVESHIAQMAPAGAMRLWAEPETGGESYIPHAKSKRARSLQIWEETGRILGVNPGQTRDNRVTVNHYGDVVANSPAEYAEDMRRHQREEALLGQGG